MNYNAVDPLVYFQIEVVRQNRIADIRLTTSLLKIIKTTTSPLVSR